MQMKINEIEIHSNNHRIPCFIFWRHFDDEGITNGLSGKTVTRAMLTIPQEKQNKKIGNYCVSNKIKYFLKYICSNQIVKLNKKYQISVILLY